MDKTGKFLLPSPKFKKLEPSTSTPPHFLSPHGMQLLPSDRQPPPMYGPRGATHPSKFLSPLKVPTTNNQFDRKQKYFCEPCEAEFHTSTDYKVHKNEHVECEIDDCKFQGHPAFMETHIGQQHATGLYDQLKKLSTPEEIAQWRADRKKNYPTVASVEQKWKAREQRLLRGEKLELENKKRFGKQGDRRQMKGDKSGENVDSPESKKRKQNKNKNKRLRTRNKLSKKEKVPNEPKEESAMDEKVEDTIVNSCGGLQAFRGTGQMSNYKKVKKIEKNVLSSLLGMYGSDSDDESENESEEENVCKDDNKTISEDKSKEVLPLYSSPKELNMESDPDNQTTGVKQSLEPVEVPVNKTRNISDVLQSAKTVEPRTSDDEALKEKQQSSDEEGPEEVAISKTINIPDKTHHMKSKPTAPKRKSSQDCPNTPNAPNKPQPSEEAESSDDEAPEEVAISKSTNIPDKPKPEPPRKKSKPNPPKQKSGLDYRKLRVGRQNTMLEKLLETDIRHERNVLLQCVRFVVENNFFDKPKSTQS